MSVAVLRSWTARDGRHGQHLYLWCPGCDELHSVEVDPTADGPVWQWDGNLEAPTISPSLLVRGVQWDDTVPEFRRATHNVAPGQPTACHSFIRAGRWEFLGDSTHHLAGQTVPLPPLPDWITR